MNIFARFRNRAQPDDTSAMNIRQKADEAFADAKLSSDPLESARLYELCERLHWQASRFEHSGDV